LKEEVWKWWLLATEGSSEESKKAVRTTKDGRELEKPDAV